MASVLCAGADDGSRKATKATLALSTTTPKVSSAAARTKALAVTVKAGGERARIDAAPRLVD